MFFVCQSVRIHEMRIHCTECGGFFVHHLDETVNRTADMLGNHHGRIISGGDHHSVEQLTQGERVSFLDITDRGAILNVGSRTCNCHKIVEITVF